MSGSGISARLDDMGIELATGRMNPSAALDELESIAQSIQDKALI